MDVCPKTGLYKNPNDVFRSWSILSLPQKMQQLGRDPENGGRVRSFTCDPRAPRAEALGALEAPAKTCECERCREGEMEPL